VRICPADSIGNCLRDPGPASSAELIIPSYARHPSKPCLYGLTCLHCSLIGFAFTVPGHVGPLCRAEVDAATSLSQQQGIGHRNVGCREPRRLHWARAQAVVSPTSTGSHVSSVSGAPVFPLGLWCEIAGGRNVVIGTARPAPLDEGIVGSQRRRDRAGPARAASARSGPSDTP
jgi:hypothetical protein